MRLPDDLNSALSLEISTMPRGVLAKAAQELSARYRSQARDKRQTFMTEDAHRLAYLAVRMPATYAVVWRVLSEIKQGMPDFNPLSLCDIGAGPGTASWAAVDQYPQIAQVTLHEKDVNWLSIGQRLMQHADHQVLQQACWRQSDLRQGIDTVSPELVILSYVIGELPLEELPALVSKTWAMTSQVLVIIEPGTPHGFERIRAARQQLINSGAFLIAPCPHCDACPMSKGDWCHFSQRLERSSMHMAVKDVVMGYEDEKFSYVAAAKTPVPLPEARILRHPQQHSGHVELFLCAREGLEQRVISRRQGALYKQARKLEWGDKL